MLLKSYSLERFIHTATPHWRGQRAMLVERNFVSKHLVPLVVESCRKEFTFLYPGHKDMVAFPQRQPGNLFIGYPFQLASRLF